MKNFPHQYSDLNKLRATLDTVNDMKARGADPRNDAALGYELARRRVYRFRGIDYDAHDQTVDQRIDAQIETEKRKPAGNQGTRTAAREMRRTLRFLGWLEGEGANLTPAGNALLGTSEGSDEERILMQLAIGTIAVTDRDGNVSHPVQLLLRLVDEVSLNSRSGMEAILEAVDDSLPEFQRIAVIAALPQDERVRALTALGWTVPQLANAVKILPAFAELAGLITKDGKGQFILADAGRHILAGPSVRIGHARGGNPRASRRSPRATSTATRDPSKVGRPWALLDSKHHFQSPEEQMITAALLRERTRRHQKLVNALATECRSGVFHEDAAAYDLVIELDSSEFVILVEVKTLAGDAREQLVRALGQLFYYEHFAVGEKFPGRTIQKVVVVDEPVDHELAAFLQVNGVGLLVYSEEGGFVGVNTLGSSNARELFGR